MQGNISLINKYNIIIFSTEAEELYNHVSEIFNIWSKSQYFLKEEQNFISANEIDNMVRKFKK